MRYTAIFILLFIEISLFADGLMIPVQEDYPYSNLNNKISSVEVDIQDLIVETNVYQVFQSEWNDTVDAVFAFPLPQGARAVRLQYSIGDTMVDAILKVKQQSTTPGTGEGGVVAKINKYLGSNVIKLTLTGIEPYGIKAVQLTYISELLQYDGRYEYQFPLDTKDFVNHPLDYLSLDLTLHASDQITSFDLPSHPDFQTIHSSGDSVHISLLQSKAYANADIEFSYTVDSDSMQVSLFTWNPDSTDGYFTMIGHPQKEAADTSLPSHVLFLLSNSNTMLGNKLNQSKRAISLALDQMDANDNFQVMVFNSSVTALNTGFVPATQVNIASTKSMLESIETASGNRLDIGLQQALADIPSEAVLSSIVAFSDGKSPGDPEQIETANLLQTGIHFVAIGEEVDRTRLEAIASRNYGSVYYLREDDLLAEEMMKTIKRISQPILKNIDLTFDDPGVYAMYPVKFPAIYAGTDFLVTGRYTIPGAARILLDGLDHQGLNQYDFPVFFTDNFELARQVWAKAAIDQLEATILIEGESDTLKNELIALSLDHNIRCRYTAFEEDESFEYLYSGEDEWTTGWDDSGEIHPVNTDSEKSSMFMGNYPNPFSSYTRIEINIAEMAGVDSKYLYFYDINGKLLKVIDISALGPGTHEILLQGAMLGKVPRGIILAYLVIDGKPVNTLKIIYNPERK